MSHKECRDAVAALGWEPSEVKWETPKCIELDPNAPKLATLISAFLPLSHEVRQAPDGVRSWDATGWREAAIIDGPLTHHGARGLAFQWADSYGYHPDDIRDRLQVSVRYVNKLEFASNADEPF